MDTKQIKQKLQSKEYDFLRKNKHLGVKDLDINGYDLMEIGIPQGKAIGIILNSLLECVLENPELNNKNILLEIAKNTHL